MNRVLFCIALGLAFLVYRQQAAPTPRPPVPDVTPDVTPSSGLVALARQMTADERLAMREGYQILARMIAANPTDEPVFPTTGSVREAHRAALLAVWRGVLGNEPGKYAGLREELEKGLAQKLGSDDVPLNPTLQQEAVRAFQQNAAAFSQ